MDNYDREFLQNYDKYAIWLTYEPNAVTQIIREASRGSKRYLIDGRLFLKPHPYDQITDWIVSRLRQKFPRVSIEYREATNLNGDVERGIVVDWS